MLHRAATTGVEVPADRRDPFRAFLLDPDMVRPAVRDLRGDRFTGQGTCDEDWAVRGLRNAVATMTETCDLKLGVFLAHGRAIALNRQQRNREGSD